MSTLLSNQNMNREREEKRGEEKKGRKEERKKGRKKKNPHRRKSPPSLAKRPDVFILDANVESSAIFEKRHCLASMEWSREEKAPHTSIHVPLSSSYSLSFICVYVCVSFKRTCPCRSGGTLSGQGRGWSSCRRYRKQCCRPAGP